MSRQPPKSKKGGSSDAEEDRVNVVVRIRPPVRHDEKFGEGSEALQVDKEKNLLFLLTKTDNEGGSSTKQYVFDRVLWKDSTQNDAWEAAGLSVIKGALQGYTGCVMCYGQTGAGKTHTLGNRTAGQEGIMIRALQYIFAQAASDRSCKYEVSLAFVQIYLDTISDLLEPEQNVELREDPKEGVYVSGASWVKTTDMEQAMDVLTRGMENRSTAATKMNADSSRSHAVLIANVRVSGGLKTLNGKLYLVDLAGSERVKKSGVEGSAFDEAKAINQSLTILGRCIEILASSKKERPPFRESKLTRLLSGAIGGAAKTTLVVCVAPSFVDKFETVNSLEFGQQAMNVVVRAKVNASTDFSSLTASLVSQRAAKQRPIHELELAVFRELRAELNEVACLELEMKAAMLQTQLIEEEMSNGRKSLEEAKAAAKLEAAEDAKAKKLLLGERAAVTEELEKTLIMMSDNEEMRALQAEHEAEKARVSSEMAQLQEALSVWEAQEAQEAQALDVQLEGAIHTARNLGQIAAYYLQTGAAAEAAAFYSQAAAIFESLLGADHPQTLQWQEELFFLINAPQIQLLVQQQREQQQREQQQREQQQGTTNADGDGGAANGDAAPAEGAATSAEEWWMRNLLADGVAAPGTEREDGPLGPNSSWWMQNLFDMSKREAGALEGGDGAPKLTEQVLSTTSGEDGLGALFTSRGTLRGDSELAQGKFASGVPEASAVGRVVPPGLLRARRARPGIAKKRREAAARAGGNKASVAEEPDGVDDEDADVGFAAEWVQQIFMTPRVGADADKGGEGKIGARLMTPRTAEDLDLGSKMNDAFEWLQANFSTGAKGGAGAAPPTFTGRGAPPSAKTAQAWTMTPRAPRTAADGTAATKQADDLVMAAAMQAVLSTPRAGRAGVDDAAMEWAMTKMFQFGGPVRQRV